MTLSFSVSPRDRILQATLVLLEKGGVEAVTTRAVSTAAGVQVPTIYRQFGDMQGLFNAVVQEGFSSYLQAKTAQPELRDPLEELRWGWDTHIEFGLTHPHLYGLMYSAARAEEGSPAARQGALHLRALLQRVAEAGQLAVSVDRAAAMTYAGAVGTTLCLLQTGAKGAELSDLMREATFRVILTPNSASPADPLRQRAATHAVSLAALLPDLSAPFSEAEQDLLLEWLRRLT